MRCLVTGAAGFVGSHLVDRLLLEGHEVCGIDAFTDYYPRFLKEKNLEVARSWNRFTFIEGNLLDLNLPELLEGIDWVFHQAAQAGVRASWGQIFSCYTDYNVLATQRLLEAVFQAKSIQRFIYASSSSIYGNARVLPVAETATPLPISPYGVTKLAGEHLCALYRQNFGLPVVSLRYFTVYGPRQRPDMAFHRFCKALFERQLLHIYDDGRQTRDFTYVSDVVEANLRAATFDAAVGQVLNIGGGACVTLRDVIELLQEITGISPHLQFKEKQYGDVRDTFADTNLARSILDYSPVQNMHDGLCSELEYIKSLYGY